MPKSATALAERQRAIGEMRPEMVKAVLPERESVNFRAELGACLDFARRSAGWTVDQLAAELGRDSKQVARWMRGEERTQVDVVFAVKVLRQPFVIALANLTAKDDSGVVIRTTVELRQKVG